MVIDRPNILDVEEKIKEERLKTIMLLTGIRKATVERKAVSIKLVMRVNRLFSEKAIRTSPVKNGT